MPQLDAGCASASPPCSVTRQPREPLPFVADPLCYKNFAEVAGQGRSQCTAQGHLAGRVSLTLSVVGGATLFPACSLSLHGFEPFGVSLLLIAPSNGTFQWIGYNKGTFQ